MQSSGDPGVVVVSFGSMVPNLTMERTNVIATALGRIPQKVRALTGKQNMGYHITASITE